MKDLLIIGGGNMGYAIASGITTSKTYSKNDITIIETSTNRTKFLKQNRYKVLTDIKKALHKKYEAIILAVKPQDIKDLLTELKKLKSLLSNNTLVISIAAGIKIKKISFYFHKTQPIIRVMPNTPCQIGKGISAISFSQNVTKKQKRTAKKIFQSLGEIVEINENKIDLVTALSGSGPAYFCYLVESLINAGIKFGIKKDTAEKLVKETGLGTMELLRKNSLSPATLRKYVTSSGGTTEAAIRIFNQNNFANIISTAIKAAMDRSKELIFLIVFYFILTGAHVYSQEPLQISTETEDISLTDDINIARAQVAKYPKNPEAHFNLAIALSRTSLVEEAIKELRRTKKLIRKEENKGIIDKKIHEYKEIIKNNPEASNIRYRLAFSYYLKAYLISKDIEKNLTLFDAQKLILADRNPEIKKNLELSLFYFDELLKLKADDMWAKVYYAFILAEQYGDFDKARKLWTEVIQKDPNNPAPHLFLGELHIKEGRLKEGIVEISQALLLRSLGN